MSDETDIDLHDLPSDPAVLQSMVRLLWRRLKQLERRLAVFENERSQPLRPRSTEDTNQGYLFDELFGQPSVQSDGDAQVDDDEDDDPGPGPAGGGGGASRKRGNRTPLPPGLPRVVERHERHEDDPERECSCCGKLMVEVGVRKTEQLDILPVTLIAREHQQVVYGCPDKCDANLARAIKPAQPIERGIPGAGLLAQVIVNRFYDHLPYYRQAQMFERQGVQVSRSSLSRWMHFAADLLEPIVEHMEVRLKRSRRIHTDDTTFPILEPGLGKTRAAKIWTYAGDEDYPHTIYKVTLRRTRDGPQETLADYSGALQADAFSGYDCVYASGRIVEVACWAHAVRKFEAALAHDVRAAEIMALVSDMYDVEKKGRELSEEERKALRRELVVPILARIHARCDELAATVRPKSSLATAIGYVSRQRGALERFASTGHLSPDNNAAERSLRGLAIGRRNWLFGGTLEAAQKAAILLSLVESCARNAVNTFEYLRDVLQRVSTHPHSRIEELTPAGWAAMQVASAARA